MSIKILNKDNISLTDYRVRKVFDNIKSNNIDIKNKSDVNSLDNLINDENIGKLSPVKGDVFYLANNTEVTYDNGYFYENISLPPVLESGDRIRFIKGNEELFLKTVTSSENIITNIEGYSCNFNFYSHLYGSFVQTVAFESDSSKIFGPVKREIVLQENPDTKEQIEVIREVVNNKQYTYTEKLYYVDEDFSKDNKKIYEVCWESASELKGKDNSSGKFVGVTLKEGWDYITKLVEDGGDGELATDNSKRNNYFFLYNDNYYRYRSVSERKDYLYNKDAKDGTSPYSHYFLPTSPNDREFALTFLESKDEKNSPSEMVLYGLGNEFNVESIDGDLLFLGFKESDISWDDSGTTAIPKDGAEPIFKLKMFTIENEEELRDDQTLQKNNFKNGVYFFKEIDLKKETLKLYNMAFEPLDVNNGFIDDDKYKIDISKLKKPFNILDSEGNLSDKTYVLDDEYAIHSVLFKDTSETSHIKKNLNDIFSYIYNPAHDAYFIESKNEVLEIVRGISNILSEVSFDSLTSSYGNLGQFLKNHADVGILTSPLINNNKNLNITIDDLVYENQNTEGNSFSGFWAFKTFKELYSNTKIVNNIIEKGTMKVLDSDTAFKLLKVNNNYYYLRITENIKYKENDISTGSPYTPVSLDLSSNGSQAQYVIDSKIYNFYEDLETPFTTKRYFYKINYSDNEVELIYIPRENNEKATFKNITLMVKNSADVYEKVSYTFKKIDDDNGIYEATSGENVFIKSLAVKLNNGNPYRNINIEEKVAYQGKIYLYIEFNQKTEKGTARKRFLTEIKQLEPDDYILFDEEKINYNILYNCFAKEIDNDYIYIVESTPTENDIINLNLNAGETKKEYYKYSRKTHSFFKDFFLKRAERPISKFLIYPRIGYRSRIDILNNQVPYFEGIREIESQYMEGLLPNVHFNYSDKSSDAYSVENNFINQEKFPTLYKHFMPSTVEDYNIGCFRKISDILFKTNEEDFSSNREIMSRGSWCCFDSRNSHIFKNELDKIIEQTLGGKFSYLNEKDIEFLLAKFSASVVSSIEIKLAKYKEELLNKLQIDFSNLEKAFIDFRRLFADIFGEVDLSLYFVNVGIIFSDLSDVVWSILTDSSSNYDRLKPGFGVYEAYQDIIERCNRLEISNISSAEEIQELEFVYLLLNFFEDNKMILNMSVNSNENKPNISDLKLIYISDEEGNIVKDNYKRKTGKLQFNTIINSTKISYVIDVFCSSENATKEVWKDTEGWNSSDSKINELLITHPSNSEDKYAIKLQIDLNMFTDNDDKDFSEYVCEGTKSTIGFDIAEKLKIFYLDCQRFRYQYAYMIYQLNKIKSSEKYMYEDYNLFIE